MSAIFGSKAAAPGRRQARGRRLAERPDRRRAVCGTGCAGAIRRCRADPRQGGRRQGREAGMAHLDRRSDEGARHQFQLRARKELAKELGYTGDSNDSASMNIWLHKQVMAKLAANGGKLPPEIKLLASARSRSRPALRGPFSARMRRQPLHWLARRDGRRALD